MHPSPGGEGEQVRLKRKYLAVIVVIMIVGVAFVASMVYGSVQATRVAYVAVRADQQVFTSAEDVTFQLIPLTEGVQFTVEDQGGRNWYGVHVIRIPDAVDPKEVATNLSLLNMFASWDRGYAVVPTGSFNSTGEPLSLSWNGTMYMPGLVEGKDWVTATSGYYLLYPRLQWSYGHVTKFMLDEGAVFYYDSLRVNISTERTETSFSMGLSISLGEGMPEGEYVLRSQLNPMIYDDGYQYTYLNRTFDLRAGEKISLELGPVGAEPYMSAQYDAVVIGPDGRVYAFGFNKSGIDYGGWFNEFQY